MLLKKLGKISFAIRIASQIMQLQTIRSFYYAYFHSSLTYGIIFGITPKGQTGFHVAKEDYQNQDESQSNDQL